MGLLNLKNITSKYRVLALILFVLAVLTPLTSVAAKYFDDVFAATYRSTQVSPSTSGVLRLATGDAVGWRNAANSGNLLLNLDGSNNLQFNSVALATATQLALKAPLASPTFTGTVTAPTVSISTALSLGVSSDTTTTGAAATLTAAAPIVVLSNASLTSIQNLSSTSNTVIIKNGKASGTLTITNNSGGTAANRIVTGTGTDLTMANGAGILLAYDTVNSRWQVIGGSGGGASAVTYTDYTKGAAPAVPSAGNSRLFLNTDGRSYIEDENGFFTDIGGATGTVGNREYIANTNARYGTSSWNLYNDSAATPVDLTGGVTTGLTLTRTTSSGEYVSETQGFKLAKDAANRQGLGFSTDITLDLSDYEPQKPVWVSFLYKTSANYATGDLVCYAYDSATPGTPMALVVGASTDAGKITASLTTRTFTGFFTPSSSTSSGYRLGCHIATTNATAWNLFFGKVHAGSISFFPGAIVGETTSATCTSSWTANTTTTCKYTRIGGWAEFEFTNTLTGAPTASSLNFTLPSGFVIDTTRLTGTPATSFFIDGTAQANRGAAATRIFPYYGGTNIISVGYISSTTTAALLNVSATGPVTWASGDQVTVKVRIPIVGWPATTLVANTELPITTVSARYYGATATLVSATTADVTYSTRDYDPLTVYSGATFTAPKTAKYHFTARLQVAATWSATNAQQLWAEKNGSSTLVYGTTLSRTDAASSSSRNLTSTGDVQMSKGDTLKIRANIEGTSPTVGVSNNTNTFEIYEIPDFTIYGAMPSSASLDPSTNLTFFDDFLSAYYAGSGQIFSEHNWTSMQTGGPAFTPNGSTIPSTAAHPGVMEFTISTNADGAGISTGLYANYNNLAFVAGGGQTTLEALIYLNALSNGTNDGGINFGFMDAPGWSAPTNSMYIKYQSVTSLNWYCETYSAGAGTTVTSSIPVTTGWHKLKLIVNAAGTSVDSYVDGVLACTNSSNVPTTKLPPMLTYRKTAGNGAMYLGLDYIKIDKTFTVAR
jgi:hypothetical protein